MNRNRNFAGRYFMAAMISALIHTTIVLAVVIIWSLVNLEPDYPDSNLKLSSNPRIFWESKTDLQAFNPIVPIKAELAPFTAQLIPIAMVNSGNKLSDPIQSMIKGLRGHHVPGLQNELKTIARSQKSKILLGSLRVESAEERIGILIDKSLSMGFDGAWGQVVHEFDAFLPTISPETRARIWLFDKNTEEIGQSVDWGTWNQARLREALNQIHETRPGGLTDLSNALRTVSFRGSTRIVVISDDANLSINDWVSIASSLRRLGKPAPKVCAIRLGPATTRKDVLEEICRQTGGWCRHIIHD